ncbi:MAG TPA: hypothetical protein VFT86_09900 [Gaiellaceae bacterium]|nr:hypothetical protein [Gaiellaceae bacterium]
MAKIFERLRTWWRKSDERESDEHKSPMDVGETHRPSGAIGHGATVPPNYVPPSDEGRPPH